MFKGDEMIAPPKKVNFGSCTFDVEIIDKLLDGDRGKKLDGHIKYLEGKIRIEKEACPQHQISTFIHEVLHRIIMVHGHEQHIKPEELEGLIDSMADGILSLLRLNPDVVSWIRNTQHD